MNFGMILLIIKVLSFNLFTLQELLLFKFNGDLFGKKLVITEPFLGMQFGPMEIIKYLNILELLILMILKLFLIFLNLLVKKILTLLSKKKLYWITLLLFLILNLINKLKLNLSKVLMDKLKLMFLVPLDKLLTLVILKLIVNWWDYLNRISLLKVVLIILVKIISVKITLEIIKVLITLEETKELII